MPTVHIKPIRITEDAIDIHGHVNNQEYLRWMQDIAIEHSSLQGWPMDRYITQGASWYVKSHFIEYVKPALLDDDILACTWVAGMDSRSSLRKTLFLRQTDRQVLARAETQWIFVSLKTGRPLLIPEDLRTAFDLIDSEQEALGKIDHLLSQPRIQRPSP